MRFKIDEIVIIAFKNVINIIQTFECGRSRIQLIVKDRVISKMLKMIPVANLLSTQH